MLPMKLSLQHLYLKNLNKSLNDSEASILCLENGNHIYAYKHYGDEIKDYVK